MSSEVRILVVDDHPLFRQGVVATLASQPGFRVVAEAQAVGEAIERVRQLRPDVVLLDVALPDGYGLDAIGPILAECPETKVVMLTVANDGDTVIQAIRAGAAGYLLKGASGFDLVTALKTIIQGETYTSPEAAARVVSDVANRRSEPGSELTPRERTVLDMLGQGLTNREIGQRLYLSEKTIKRHVTVIMQKLGVRNRVEAALLASSQKDTRPR